VYVTRMARSDAASLTSLSVEAVRRVHGGLTAATSPAHTACACRVAAGHVRIKFAHCMATARPAHCVPCHAENVEGTCPKGRMWSVPSQLRRREPNRERRVVKLCQLVKHSLHTRDRALPCVCHHVQPEVTDGVLSAQPCNIIHFRHTNHRLTVRALRMLGCRGQVRVDEGAQRKQGERAHTGEHSERWCCHDAPT
jgi:hypothetical protein